MRRVVLLGLWLVAALLPVLARGIGLPRIEGTLRIVGSSSCRRWSRTLRNACGSLIRKSLSASGRVHGGTIKVESNPGKGSTLTLYLQK